jgi:hypothetical protein
MDITDADRQSLKEGLRDIVFDQYSKKHDKVMKVIEEHNRQYREKHRTTRKDGRRFSQDTQNALDEHVQHLHDTAAEMRSLSRKLKQHANDLAELYQSEGQGPAYASD